MPRKPGYDDLTEGDVQLKNRPEVKEPRLYRVFILNDHYTTMEFVVKVLVEIFNKPAAEATLLMMDVHKKGRGLCGVYTYDIAMTKVASVHTLATQNGFPLKCTYEEV